MSDTNISVWFVCKSCQNFFRKVEEFIEHKKEKHFSEFQRTNCIVFEETSDQNTDNSLFPVVSIKEEYELSSDDEESAERTVDADATSSSSNLAANNVNQAENNNFNSKVKPDDFQSHSDSSEPTSPNVTEFDSNLSYSLQHSIFEIPSTSTPAVEYPCKFCFSKHNSEEEMKIHERICGLFKKERDGYCVPCQLKFEDAKSLKSHRLEFHATEVEAEKRKLYTKCQLCQKRIRKRTLKTHLKSHRLSEEQTLPFPCELCERSFSTKNSLQAHMQAHSDDRPFRCSKPNCGKTFKYQSSLRKHLLGHLRQKSKSGPS